MALRDIKIPTVTIAAPGGEFTVRGLSLDDVAWLVQRHGAALNALFARFVAEEHELTAEGVSEVALPVIQEAPGLAAELIACAADDPQARDVVRTLPFPVQVEAVEQIAQLTFHAEGGPKKFVETVIRMMQGTTGLLESL